MTRLPMPPGYTPTIPVGGGESPHPEPGEIRFVVEPPAPSWWRENHEAILSALPLPAARYINRAEGEPWIVFFGIVTVAVLIALAVTDAVLR